MKPVGRIASGLFVLGCALTLPPRAAIAQSVNGVRVRVTVIAADRPAREARVRADSLNFVTGDSGVVTLIVPSGSIHLIATKLGFTPDSVSFPGRSGMDTSVTIRLAPLPGSLSAIVVTSTLTEQRLEDVPIRVEVLSGEDIDEKNSMRPGDLTQMVVEIPGVRVQPLSSGATGASLRVQGFRSQYSEILSDGLPLTGPNDAGLSLVQLPPLDLAQVEVVKVGASALYGDDALGGALNFISRRPPAWGEHARGESVLSASSPRELDGVTFAGVPLSPSLGATVLASAHRSPASDGDRDGLADLARTARVSVRPRLFWKLPSGAKGFLTAGVSSGRRVNGFLGDSAANSAKFFRDSLRTTAIDVGGSFHVSVGDSVMIDFRFALQTLERRRNYLGVLDRDNSSTAFLQSAATFKPGRATIVAGSDVRTERSHSLDITGFDYRFITTSGFAQVSGPLAAFLSYSLTARCEHQSRYGAACVPLAALLAKPSDEWTVRFSNALGTRAPKPFTEESAITGLSRTRPFSGSGSTGLGFERTLQSSLDAGYHAGGLDLNATLYASRIKHAVGIRDLKFGPYAQELAAAILPTTMRGADFFAVYTGDPISLTAFYGILRTKEENLDAPAGMARREIPLSPRNRAGLDVAVDVEEIGARVAVEAYYTGVQPLADNPYRRQSRPFTTVEALATEKLGRALVFVALENLTNVVQSSYDPVLLPNQARSGRRTVDSWAPLSGRTIRLGARFDYLSAPAATLHSIFKR